MVGLPGASVFTFSPGRPGQVNAETLNIELPDGSKVEVPAGTPARELVQRVEAALDGKAIAAKLDDDIIELARQIGRSGRLSFLTEDDGDEDALYVLRHSAAHVLATAVRRLWPDAGIGFGPPIAT